MFTLEEQHDRYNALWEQYAPLYGTAIMEDDPEPIYHIGTSLTEELYPEMQRITDLLSPLDATSAKWLAPKSMHITIELPGRLGTHFTEDDVPNMTSTLQSICKEHDPFTVQLGNINCFPQALYREVYDPDQELYRLHTQIATGIPWSQHPEYRFENFIPHMSLNYLKEHGASLLTHPEFHRELPILNMLVTSMYFKVSSDTMKTKTIACVEIGTGNLL